MDRFLIVFPTGEELDFAVSKLAQELYRDGPYPLFDVIKKHIERHGKEANDAEVYEVVEVGDQLIYLTTY